MPGWIAGSSRSERRSALRLLGEPLLDFLAELWLEDAADVIALLDLGHRPVLAHLDQGIDVAELEEVALADEDLHRDADRLHLIFRQRQFRQALETEADRRSLLAPIGENL